MNRFQQKEDKFLKERYLSKTLDCGLKITVIPKDFPTKYAFLCCDFGAADLTYEFQGEVCSFPAGVAHFLEHKMFENPDGSDAFYEFDRFGGNANAFTSFENTCFFFSCTENFFENLEILLRSVSDASFTDASVEKEKKIIGREIMMYEDQPTSVIMQNLYKTLYTHNPLTKSIAGTLESIEEITKETLFEAFERFYVPENLSLCVCGDVDMEKVSQMAEAYFGKKSGKRPKTLYKPEPPFQGGKVSVAESVVASPLYAIGIPCAVPEKNDLETYRKTTAMRLAISLIFGRASDFYCKNYALGLLNERFYGGYTSTKNTSHIIISGSGKDYEKILDLVKEEIRFRKKNFFTHEQILREKKAAYAESITLFDSGEDLAATASSNAFLEYDEFDCIEVLRNITDEEVFNALNRIDSDLAVMSIIKNTEKKGIC